MSQSRGLLWSTGTPPSAYIEPEAGSNSALHAGTGTLSEAEVVTAMLKASTTIKPANQRTILFFTFLPPVAYGNVAKICQFLVNFENAY